MRSLFCLAMLVGLGVFAVGCDGASAPEVDAEPTVEEIEENEAMGALPGEE